MCVCDNFMRKLQENAQKILAVETSRSVCQFVPERQEVDHTVNVDFGGWARVVPLPFYLFEATITMRIERFF